MNPIIDNVLSFFFKRKYIVILLTILLLTTFLAELLVNKKFNLSTFGGTLYFGSILGYFITNKNKLNDKYSKN